MLGLLRPDGASLASGGGDSTTLVHGVESGELVARLLTAVRTEGPTRVEAVDFSPTGARLATAAEDGRITLWQTGTWERVLDFAAHPSELRDLAFRGDGVQLASGSIDGRIGIWDARKAPVEAPVEPREGTPESERESRTADEVR